MVYEVQYLYISIYCLRRFLSMSLSEHKSSTAIDYKNPKDITIKHKGQTIQ